LEAVTLPSGQKLRRERDETFGVPKSQAIQTKRKLKGLKAMAHARAFSISRSEQLALRRKQVRNRANSVSGVSSKQAVSPTSLSKPAPEPKFPRLIELSLSKAGGVACYIVPQNYKTITESETYIFDQGQSMYQWNNPKSTHAQHEKATEISTALRKARENCVRTVVDSEKQSAAGYSKAMDIFWTKLGEKPPTDYVFPKGGPTNKPILTWWEVTRDNDTGIKAVRQSMALTYRAFTRSSTLIIDVGFEIIVFLGIDARPQVKYWTGQLAKKLMARYKKRQNHSLSFAFYGVRHPLLDALIKNKNIPTWKPPLVKKPTTN